MRWIYRLGMRRWSEISSPLLLSFRAFKNLRTILVANKTYSYVYFLPFNFLLKLITLVPIGIFVDRINSLVSKLRKG